MSEESDSCPKQVDAGGDRITEEYRILHNVAQIVNSSYELKELLRLTMQAITNFDELRVENKAGIFLADEEKKVLRLFITYGNFSEEFLKKEQEVPFGECLCGRVAEDRELLMSENCFTDSRHERLFNDMSAHGHYIVPLKTGSRLMGILFLYTHTHPSWYRHSQEVLLSIGGLIARAIERNQVEKQLAEHREQLEMAVHSRTRELEEINRQLAEEIEEHKLTQDNLRNLSQKIQAIREEEKARMSREVHDELGQSLTALKMDLLHLKGKPGLDEDLYRKKLDSMVVLVDDTLKSVQRIAMELRPPILDAFGLSEAIAWQAMEFEKRFDLKFDCRGLEEIPELSKGLKTALFRIFQESSTNVVRHAAASEVRVSLCCKAHQVRLEIGDDGKGMNPEEANDMHSLGLIGIKERIRPWNGEVVFWGQPGKGTRVTVNVPLKQR